VGEELSIRHGGCLGRCGERRKEGSVRGNMRCTGERGGAVRKVEKGWVGFAW
jgi:hypothetical protein